MDVSEIMPPGPDFSRVRLVGLDLDDTVFTHDKQITPRTRKAILTAVNAGIHVLPTTGRPITGIPSVFTEIPGVRYALGCNGAIVQDLATGEMLVHECMEKQTALYIYESLSGLDCIVECYLDGHPHSDRKKLRQLDHFFPNPNLWEYVRKTRIPEDDVYHLLKNDNRGVEKISVAFPTLEAADEGERIVSQIPGIVCVKSVATNLELSRADVDKGEGLLLLADYLHLPRNTVLACGDSGNDLAMIKKAGIGVAMKNALDEVKAAADYVLPYTNEEEGVAWLLEQIIALKS